MSVNGSTKVINGLRGVHIIVAIIIASSLRVSCIEDNTFVGAISVRTFQVAAITAFYPVQLLISPIQCKHYVISVSRAVENCGVGTAIK